MDGNKINIMDFNMHSQRAVSCVRMLTQGGALPPAETSRPWLEHVERPPGEQEPLKASAPCNAPLYFKAT